MYLGKQEIGRWIGKEKKRISKKRKIDKITRRKQKKIKRKEKSEEEETRGG